jgi:hypothetical protein
LAHAVGVPGLPQINEVLLQPLIQIAALRLKMFHVRPRHSLATKSVHFPARGREVTRNNDPFKDPFTIASRLWFDPFSRLKSSRQQRGPKQRSKCSLWPLEQTEAQCRSQTTAAICPASQPLSSEFNP